MRREVHGLRPHLPPLYLYHHRARFDAQSGGVGALRTSVGETVTVRITVVAGVGALVDPEAAADQGP